MTSWVGRLLVAAALVAVGACGQSSPSVLATEQFSDSRGDATADLVGITARATAESVLLDFEFTTQQVRDESILTVAISEPESPAEPVCDGYMSQYFVWIPAITPIPSGEAHEADLIGTQGELIAWLDVTHDGARVTVDVPLVLIGSPSSLHFHTTAWHIGSENAEVDSDNSPDSAGACHAAPLGS